MHIYGVEANAAQIAAGVQGPGVYLSPRSGAICANAAQALTTSQKQQARANLDAHAIAAKFSLARQDVVDASQSGVVNGSATSDGLGVWVCTGAGYDTTAKGNGYITGALNTYCHLIASAPIARSTQVYQGAMATVAIGLDANLTDMVHANFGPTSVSISYWKTGKGSSLSPEWQWGKSFPTINDGARHTCTLEMVGNYAFCWLDGDLVNISYSADYASVTGPETFAQIHAGAGDRIYSVTTETRTISPTARLENIDSVYTIPPMFAQTLKVGSIGAQFAPVDLDIPSQSNVSRAVIRSSDGSAQVALMSATGYGSQLRFGQGSTVAAIAGATEWVGWNPGISGMEIGVQGSRKIAFPASAYGPGCCIPEIGVGSVATTTPTIKSGAGAPSATPPNGSMYIRTDGTTGSTIYARVNGAWVGIA